MTIEQWQERRAQLRADFLRMLGPYPERTSVSYEALAPRYEFSEVQWRYLRHPESSGLTEYVLPDEDIDNADYTRLHVRYPGVFPESPVTAYLRIPKNLTGPAPAVLCLHGHVRGCFFGKEWQDTTAAELAKRGFITLAPDALPFGERRNAKRDQEEWDDYSFLDERIWYQTLAFHGQSLQGVHVWELQRALDILQAMPEVDGSLIGAVGSSGGGINTVWLSAMDERVACAVSNAGVMEYARLAREWSLTASWNFCPILTVGDVVDLLSLVAPRAFLGIEGEHDSHFNGLYNRDHVYPLVRPTYDLYGKDENLAQVVHPGGHDYTDEIRNIAYDWLEKHLK